MINNEHPEGDGVYDRLVLDGHRVGVAGDFFFFSFYFKAHLCLMKKKAKHGVRLEPSKPLEGQFVHAKGQIRHCVTF